MKFVNTMNSLMVKSKIKFNSFLQDEKGDTNFISVLVLLGIALALAGVFLVFKSQILTWVDTAIGSFFETSAGR